MSDKIWSSHCQYRHEPYLGPLDLTKRLIIDTSSAISGIRSTRGNPTEYVIWDQWKLADGAEKWRNVAHVGAYNKQEDYSFYIIWPGPSFNRD